MVLIESLALIPVIFIVKLVVKLKISNQLNILKIPKMREGLIDIAN